MLTLRRIINLRTSIPLSLLHTSTISPPQQVTRNPSLTPTSAYYDDLINDAGRSRDFHRVHHLLIKRINDGCFNTKDTFNFVTKTQNSFDIISDLFDCLTKLPKGIPRRNAFEAYINRLCRLDLINDALQVLDKMHQRDFELNACSFHPVLHALCKRKEMDKATRVIGLMREIGITLDTTSYNYILTAYCVAADVDNAVDLLGMMMRESDGFLKGDSRTYDALVLGACRAGKVEGGIMLLRAVMDEEVKLMYCTYAHVIKALMEMGYYAQAVRFVMCFVGRERGLDKENFELLGNCFIKLERFEDAKLVVDEMRKRGLDMGMKLRDLAN